MFIFAKKGKKIVWYLFCEECVCLRLFSRLSRYLRGLLDKELSFILTKIICFMRGFTDTKIHRNNDIKIKKDPKLVSFK